jgi:serine/threonine protein kinase
MPAQIGRYQVQTELGRGGFGRVFRAFDPTVSRLVALKVLTEGGKDVLTRFRNEATVAGNLHHENITTVYEYGEHEGQAFLVMEYLEGEDLHQVIASRRQLTLLHKCNIMTQVAEGLYCAHQHGVVHRDVKPANIMVLRDGTVKIMDFGIARIVGDTEATRLTRQESMLGTLMYMAPEQFAGFDTDALCDIFAFGLIYYELIGGKHPFEAFDSRAFMYKISFEDPPPLLTLAPECPEALERVIGRILHRDREVRYQSLKEVMFDTGPILNELCQSQAAHLLVQAQQLYEKAELEPARAAVLEVLSLDPYNRVARSLREDLQKQILQHALRPKIESLLRTGEKQFAQRRFVEAIQNFDAALRLKSGDVYIQGRLEQARAQMERGKKASLLLFEALRNYERQDYIAAHKAATEALSLDPENAEAGALLKTIQSASERHAQQQRIEDATVRVEGLLAQHSYDEALEVLAALSADAEAPKVVHLLERIHTEKAEFERNRRLQAETSVVTGWLREERFEQAVQRLEALQAEFPESPELSQFYSFAQRELAAQRLTRAVERLAADAAALSEAKEFGRALAALDEDLRNYPGEALLIRLLDSTTAAKADWERQQAVESALRLGAELGSQEQFAEAIQVVEAALREYHADKALSDLLQALETHLAVQKRTEAVRFACAGAQNFLDRQQPENAVQSLQQALAQYPDAPQLADMLTGAEGAVRALEKARAVAEIGREADAMIDARAFGSALDVLARGLEAWPGDGEFLRRQQATLGAKAAWEREQALQEMVRQTEALTAQRQFVEAADLAEEALRQYPDETSLLQLKQQLEADRREHERLDAIRQAADEAGVPMSASRLRAQEDAKRQEAIQDALRRCETLELENRLTDALQVAEHTIAEYIGESPDNGLDDSALRQTMHRLRAKATGEERLRERAQDIGELGRLDHEARQASAPEQAVEFLEQARRIAGRYPGDAQVCAPGADLVQQSDTIALAQRELAGKNFSGALDICAKALIKFPGHTTIGQLHAEAERGQRAAFLEDLRRRVDAETNLEVRIRLLDDALRRYPSELWAGQELRSARSQLGLVRSIVEKALAREKAEQWDEALTQWNSLAALYKGYPGLDAGIERVQRKRAQLSAAAVARWVELVGAEIERGDLPKASDMLGRALAEFSEAAALQDLGQRLEQIRQERTRVRDLVARGQEEGDKGRYAEAQVTFREAFTLPAADPASRRLALGALAKYAQAAVSSDWRSAEALATEATAIDPKYALPQGLLAAIADRKKDEIVNDCLAQAEQLRRAGDSLGALVEVDCGLLEYPEEPRLKRLRKSLAAQAREFRETVNRELQQWRQAAQAAADPVALEPMLGRAQEVAARHQADAELKSKAEETVRELTARIGELKRAQRSTRLAVQGRWMAAMAAGVLVAAGAVFGIRQFLGPWNLVSVAVTSSPDGATVKAGEEVCRTPHCQFKLKPGTYPIEARLDGYRPVVQSVQVNAANHKPIRLVLDPLRPQVQISTNFASGTVSLDGKPAGTLSNGQLTLTDIPFGKHQLQVSSPDGQTRVAFETAAGRLPSVAGTVEARDALAIVVSNLGRDARLDCNCPDERVTLDGKPVGSIASGQLGLHDLPEGTKELKLGDHPLVVSVRPEPVLNVFVTSDRNIGTLVIETNVDDPTVLINNRKYAGSASQGLIRIPLDVARYSVKLQKNGYKSPEAQTVQIQKGGTERLPFKLEPLKSALQIRGAYPGTQVAFDGKPLGDVQQDQRFSVDIGTGQHTIELSKPGYVSKRIPRRFEPGQTVSIEAADALLTPDQNTIDEGRRREEQAAWEAVNKNDRAALQQFVDQHASGRLAEDARNLIAKLDLARLRGEQQKQDQARRDEEQRKATQAEEQHKAAPEEQHKAAQAESQRKADEENRKAVEAQQQAAERKAILDLLQAYAAAYNSRDADAVRKTFPNVPDFNRIRDMFNFSRSIQVTLVPDEPPRISGDNATVRCQFSISLTDNRGIKQRAQPNTVTFSLRKSEGRWLIASRQ